MTEWLNWTECYFRVLGKLHRAFHLHHTLGAYTGQKMSSYFKDTTAGTESDSVAHDAPGPFYRTNMEMTSVWKNIEPRNAFPLPEHRLLLQHPLRYHQLLLQVNPLCLSGLRHFVSRQTGWSCSSLTPTCSFNDKRCFLIIPPFYPPCHWVGVCISLARTQSHGHT